MTDKVLEAYQKCVNEIEDYFEYANESEQDKERVMQSIDSLYDKLKGTSHGQT